MNNVPQCVDWSLAAVWNECAMKPEKPLVKRDYIYASEIGYPFIDRFLKMNAVPYTNPPNARSRRKFLAGNIVEHTVKTILITAGFYLKDEVKIDNQPYKDCLSVHGRCDFQTVHGYIDVPAAISRIYELHLPEDLYRIGETIIRSLEGVYLLGKILEIKGISTFAMDKVEKTKRAIVHHTAQAYHYQKNGGIPANIAYICKDDMRMMQFSLNVDQSEEFYRKDLEKMTYYFKKKKEPPKEPMASFNELYGKFEKNLVGVEYSPYLTALYGFKNTDEYRESVKFVDSWNRVLKRYVEAELNRGTKITAKNAEVRAQMEKAGFKLDDLIRSAIAAGIAEEEEVAEF